MYKNLKTLHDSFGSFGMKLSYNMVLTLDQKKQGDICFIFQIENITHKCNLQRVTTDSFENLPCYFSGWNIVRSGNFYLQLGRGISGISSRLYRSNYSNFFCKNIFDILKSFSVKKITNKEVETLHIL